MFYFNGLLEAQNVCTFIPNISPVPGPNHNAISSMAGCEPIVFKVVPDWSGTPQGIGEVLIEIIRDVPFEVVDLGDFTKEEVCVNGILEKTLFKAKFDPAEVPWADKVLVLRDLYGGQARFIYEYKCLSDPYYKRYITFLYNSSNGFVVQGSLQELINNLKLASQANSCSNRQQLIINGNLDIDAGYYCLLGHGDYQNGASHIRMLPGSSITVKSGNVLTLNENYVIACDGQRWNSIVVEPGAILKVFNTTFDNGHFEIEAKSGSTVIVKDSKFKDAAIGIRADEFANVDVEDSEFIFQGFNASYAGEPALEAKTWSGIYAEKSGVRVNAGSFINLLNGVRTLDSKLTVEESNFNNIWEVGNSNISAEKSNGKAIHSAGLPNNTLVSNCTVENSNWGIYTKGVNCTASNNHMKNVLTGMQFDYSPGRKFDIKHNNLAAVNRGINFSWTGEVSSIIVNERNTIQLMGQNAIGIELVETRGNLKTIFQNDIQIGDGYKGIHHLNSGGTWTYNNSIYANGTQSFPNAGISIIGGRDNLVACNYLSSSMVCDNIGIYVLESANNVDIGNHAVGWLNDFQFVGTSLGTIFANNIFGSANHGLVLGVTQGSYGDRIGVQEHMGNRWIGTYAKAAKHYGPPQDRIESKFIVNAQDPNNPDLKPNNFSELVNDGWFAHAQGSVRNWKCNLGIGSGNSNPFPRVFPRSDDYFIATDAFDAGYDWGSRIWTDRRQLYRQILEEDDAESIPVEFNNFFNAQTNTSVGQFELIEKGIRDVFLSAAIFTQSVNENLLVMESLDQSIASIKNQLVNIIDLEFQASLQSQLNVVLAQKTSLLNTQTSLVSQWNASIQNDLSQLLKTNNGIQVNAIYEQNQREVNQIMLQKMIANDWSFSETERVQIETISNQCPLYGGEGIYRARALKAIYDLDRYEDEAICNQAATIRTQSYPGNEWERISLFPNPASDRITMIVSGKDEGINEIEIYTMEGKLVMIENVKFVNNEISFSIHHLERGMYYAKVYLSDGSVGSKKFMKQ
ncbi:MAG: T9SS type A sorting domain-containing protein [Saprospiraceae bacterium]|nr:T9SS type A sorting domain-containing protein [Candidatus Vicinibacter affinis]